ncbi:MAG: hypothetical protein D6811_00860, partial [Alphaproteobacteria bacterium]
CTSGSTGGSTGVFGLAGAGAGMGATAASAPAFGARGGGLWPSPKIAGHSLNSAISSIEENTQT